MADEMLALARQNAAEAGASNVEVVQGYRSPLLTGPSTTAPYDGPMSSANERILCVDAALVDAGMRHDRLEGPDFDLFGLLASANPRFLPRGPVETDESLVQVVTYVLLRRGNEVFRYERTASGAESRLHGARSIGVGGHVAAEDGVVGTDGASLRHLVAEAARREILEEVGDVAASERQHLGGIRTHHDAVSRVHLAVVELWTFDGDDLLTVDGGLTSGQMCGITELAEDQRLEYWSQLCVRSLVESVGLDRGGSVLR